MYGDVCLKKPEEYYNYKLEKLDYGRSSDYEFIRKIGKGKYSEVYEGVDLRSNSSVVIKLLKPIKLEKIQREFSIL